MTRATNTTKEKRSQIFLPNIFFKCFSVALVCIISFCVGYFLNSSYSTNHLEIGTKTNPIERRNSRHLRPYREQLLDSFKAENLEETLRWGNQVILFRNCDFLARDQLPLSKTDRLLLFVLHRYFSKEPHLAGSKRNNDLAHHIATKWREYGFDEVTMPKYDVLMSSPKNDRKSHVEIHRNGRVIFKSQSHEKVITVCMLTVLLFWLLWLWFLSFCKPCKM